MKDDINIHSESHIKIVDITDKNKPKTLVSTRIFNKKTQINNKDKEEPSKE